MKILLLHHLESMWEEGLKKFDTSFEAEAEKIRHYINHNDFDEVVLVRFEEFELGDEHYQAGLHDLINRVETYSFGWVREETEERDPDGEGVRWADGCSHSEVVMLDDWIKDLKGHDVTLTGAFENECIATVEAAMDNCDVEYEREEGLIVGSGVDYEYQLEPGDIAEQLREGMEWLCESADTVDLPTWPSLKAAAQDIRCSVEGTDFDQLGYVETLAGGQVLKLSDNERVSVDRSNLTVDEALYSETAVPAIDKEFDPFNPETIRVLYDGSTATVHPSDYGTLKLFDEVGIDRLLVTVEPENMKLFEHYGFDVSTEEAFMATKKRLQRIAPASEYSY